MNDFKLISPETDDDWNKYFHFRWKLLRAPWGKERGSEKDEFEDQSFHIMAVSSKEEVIGVGRVHFDDYAKIRYMAVDENHRGSGLGKSILKELEKETVKKGKRKIILNARENAVGFYESAGYKVVGRAHTLYEEIRHFRMEKDV